MFLLEEVKEPLVTADWQGVAKFLLLYGTVIVGGILSVRKWVNQPLKEKYDALESKLEDRYYDLDREMKASVERATREHNEIYKEVDRRIGLEPGVSVKSMADGIGGRISGMELEIGRLEVMADRTESSNIKNHDELMRGMMQVSNQVAGLAATVGMLVEGRMQRLDRISDRLEER